MHFSTRFGLLPGISAGLVLVLSATACSSVTAATAPAPQPVPPPQTLTQPAHLVSPAVRSLANGVLPSLGSGPLKRSDVNAARVMASTGKAAVRADQPPTTATCVRDYKLPCYSVRQLARAYDVDKAHRAGWTGKGVTVVLPFPLGSPTLRHDLNVFSRAYGLPPMTRKNLVIHKFGHVPTMPEPDDPDAPLRYLYAEELTLDASMIHAMAPDAKIVVLQTPAREEEPSFFPQILKVTRAYAATHRGIITSQSYGAWETSLPKPQLESFDQQVAAISRTGATMVAANGDWGATNGQSPDSEVPWPASSAHVTAVAGTDVHLDAEGNRTSPDVVWSDRHNLGVATGGGLSERFGRPRFQDPISDQTGNRRATSDIALNGGIDSRVIIYSTYNVLGGEITNRGGWWRAAGTSESAPLFAGILALARQAARRPLGNINPALYRLGATHISREVAGIYDLTAGCNSVPGNKGFCARRGPDIVSGNGTIHNAARFVPALARAVHSRR